MRQELRKGARANPSVVRHVCHDTTAEPVSPITARVAIGLGDEGDGLKHPAIWSGCNERGSDWAAGAQLGGISWLPVVGALLRPDEHQIVPMAAVAKLLN